MSEPLKNRNNIRTLRAQTRKNLLLFPEEMFAMT